MKRPAVFFDKDGTLVRDVPYNVAPELIELAPRAAVTLRRLAARGYQLVVVSNQSGVARGYFPESALRAVRQRLSELLGDVGVSLAGFYYCPHHPAGSVADYAIACECRKPQAGMLERAAGELDLDLSASWMVGDILDDVEAGHAAGCRSILVANGGETQWRLSPERMPEAVVAHLEQAAATILGRDARTGTMTPAAITTGRTFYV